MHLFFVLFLLYFSECSPVGVGTGIYEEFVKALSDDSSSVDKENNAKTMGGSKEDVESKKGTESLRDIWSSSTSPSVSLSFSSMVPSPSSSSKAPTASSSSSSSSSPSPSPSSSTSPGSKQPLASKYDSLAPITKFLIVESSSGLSNRISSIASSAILAFLMNRVLVIDWPIDRSCGQKFSDLFVETRQGLFSKTILYTPEELYASHNNNASSIPMHKLYTDIGANDVNMNININDNEPIERKIVTECSLDFKLVDGTFRDFWALLNPHIYDDLNKQCAVIRIKSNVRFSQLIDKALTFNRPWLDHKLNMLGNDPFRRMMRKLFIPKPDIMSKVETTKKLMEGHSWMSVHARGYYELYNETPRALACVKAMLEHKYITHVFFATETQSLLNLVKETISNESLVILPKRMVDDTDGKLHDSFDIRNELAIAVLEWYLIGEASYCTIASLRSTFSTTAISRGHCHYLPHYYGSECVHHVRDQEHGFKKPRTEFVLDSIKAENTTSQPNITASATQISQFWSTIEKYPVNIRLDWVKFTTGDSIYKFYNDRSWEKESGVFDEGARRRRKLLRRRN